MLNENHISLDLRAVFQYLHMHHEPVPGAIRP
jgi:hypothetical protein